MTSIPGTPPAASRDRPASRRVLDPAERISEVLFGLIMVLTFTGSLSVAEAGREDIRARLIGALGCNIAWGIIDGVLYLMGSLAEKGGTTRCAAIVSESGWRGPGFAQPRYGAEKPHHPAGRHIAQERTG